MVFERHFPPDHSQLAPLRHDVADALDATVEPSLVADAVLVVSELGTNAITASRTSTSDILVRVHVPQRDAVVVEVQDEGPGFALDRMTRRVRLTAETGRGLKIVEAVADQVRVDRVDNRTMVRALLRRHEAF